MSLFEREDRLARMTPPFLVTLVRLLPSGQALPLLLDPLAPPEGWRREQLLGLEAWTRDHFGAGRFHAIVTDTRGETLQWLWLEGLEGPPTTRPPLDPYPVGGVPVVHGHLGVPRTQNTNNTGTVGVTPGRTVIRLPNGDAIKLEHWHCEFFHTQVPWGGSILSVESGVDAVLEVLVYGAGVLVPPQASAQHELGDLLVEVIAASGEHSPVLRAPVQALAQRQAQLWNLEEYFAPRSLWQVAAELGARLRQTTAAGIAETEGARQAQANLESVRKYIGLVHAEYTAYVAAVGPGTVLPAKVSAGGRLWLTHETTVRRGGHRQQSVEAPMYWGNGFLVESTALVHEKVV